ncbi:MAG: prepilin peptidase [Desulfobulbaceae bacterium]|jgi:leader peptidase (prepilin peptidase)/N-methyltransferase|nr:prepilin peptidase [Desulfobulbaceae bacterium]
MDIFAIEIIVFLYGAIVGSFLNVVILRLPEEGASVIFPASHCPQCQTSLSWYENIPVLSYIVLRGRCRTCRTHISIQYPLVELAMGVLAVLLMEKFTLSAAFFIYFAYVAALLVIIVIDLYHQIIPDVISLPGILYGLLASFVLPWVSWQDSLIGLLAGGGTFYLIALCYYLITKRQGMGGGDIKLLAMIGALQGWQALPFVIFCSSLLGSVIGIGAMVVQKKGGQSRIPYGPFLAVASLLYLFFDQQILHYMQLYFGG